MNIKTSEAGLLSLFSQQEGAETIQQSLLDNGILPEQFASALQEQIGLLKKEEGTVAFSIEQNGDLKKLQNFADFFGKDLPGESHLANIEAEKAPMVLPDEVLKNIEAMDDLLTTGDINLSAIDKIGVVLLHSDDDQAETEIVKQHIPSEILQPVESTIYALKTQPDETEESSLSAKQAITTEVVELTQAAISEENIDAEKLQKPLISSDSEAPVLSTPQTLSVEAESSLEPAVALESEERQAILASTDSAQQTQSPLATESPQQSVSAELTAPTQQAVSTQPTQSAVITESTEIGESLEVTQAAISAKPAAVVSTVVSEPTQLAAAIVHSGIETLQKQQTNKQQTVFNNEILEEVVVVDGKKLQQLPEKVEGKPPIPLDIMVSEKKNNGAKTEKIRTELEVIDNKPREVGAEKTISKITTELAILNRNFVSEQKTELPSMTRPFAHPEWGKEFSERVVWMHKNALPKAELNLNPRHLGPVSIRVDVSQDQATIAFTAQNAAVKEAIEASMPKLREMLTAQQLNLAEVNVSHQQTDQKQSQGFSQMAENRQGQQEKEQKQENIENGQSDLETSVADEIEAGRAIASKGILSIFA